MPGTSRPSEHLLRLAHLEWRHPEFEIADDHELRRRVHARRQPRRGDQHTKLPRPECLERASRARRVTEMDADTTTEARVHNRLEVDVAKGHPGCASGGSDHGGLASAEDDRAGCRAAIGRGWSRGRRRPEVRTDQAAQQGQDDVVFRGLIVLPLALRRNVVGHQFRRQHGRPPRGSHEVGVEPRRQFLGVRHRRRQRNDSRAPLGGAQSCDQRLERRTPGRITHQVHFVDDQASDPADDIFQRRAPAQRLELLGGRDPQLRALHRIARHVRLAGQLDRADAECVPPPRELRHFGRQRASRKQPHRRLAVGHDRAQRGDLADEGLARARRRNHHHVPGCRQHHRHSLRLQRVQPIERVEILPQRGRNQSGCRGPDFFALRYCCHVFTPALRNHVRSPCRKSVPSQGSGTGAGAIRTQPRWSKIEEVAQPGTDCSQTVDRHFASYPRKSISRQRARLLGHHPRWPVQHY